MVMPSVRSLSINRTEELIVKVYAIKWSLVAKERGPVLNSKVEANNIAQYGL